MRKKGFPSQFLLSARNAVKIRFNTIVWTASIIIVRVQVDACFCCSFQCYERIHRELIKEKRETHPNCIDLLEAKEREKNTPIVSQMEVLARNIGFVPSRSESHSTEEVKPICPQPKQHNGLRCKKCFELLVRDDEFLFALIFLDCYIGLQAACCS